MGTDRWSSRSKRDCLTILYYVIKSNFSPKNSGKKILKNIFLNASSYPMLEQHEGRATGVVTGEALPWGGRYNNL